MDDLKPFQREILRAIRECEERGYLKVTLDERLNENIIAFVFEDVFKDMKLRDYLETFMPRGL